MTFSRLFCNASLIRQNLRQHGWIGILYTLVLLFQLPLQMFMYGDPLREPVQLDNLFNLGADIAPFVMAFPAVAGLFLSRYLQARMAADLMHSLPLRRSHLLSSHIFSGLLLLLPPVWVTAAVTALVRPLKSNMYVYHGAEVWEWCLTLTVLTLFLFAFTMFVGICTGQTILQGVVVFILLLLPSALLEFINMHLSRYLYGYSNWFGLTQVSTNDWSPLLRIMDMSYNTFRPTELWIYALLSVVFLALSFILYPKRHSEKAGHAVAFTYFDPLFKAGVMFCSMLVALSYFGSNKQGMGWIIGSVLAGGLVGYIIVEMLLRKSWHILTRRLPLEFAVYSVLLGLLLYVPVSGLTGYENRVPASDKVAAVFAGGNYEQLMHPPQGGENAEILVDDIRSKDPKYIEAVTALHRAVVTARPEQKGDVWSDSYPPRQRFTLSYQLKNGRTLLRTYLVPRAGFEPELKAVMGHTDYKRERYQISQMEEDVESIRMSNLNKAFSISDPQEVQEFKGILIRELLNMSYEDQVSDQRSRGSIRVLHKPDHNGNQFPYTYDWYPSYHELGAWLEQKGYADKIRITAADVVSAEMFRDIHHSELPSGLRYDPKARMELARTEKRSVMVTDKTLISGILEHRRNFTREEGRVVVRIEYKDGTINFISLEEQEMAPALKALLP
ncbi:DUF6449 domain-containing protein [Paenibacillus sp. FSL K6-1096]|uniref:DUF6449 domain-containing protein n=1 Tax=Paenibacillus sp. FSL K6-1096 TaxID=2921460 RepID=UPI0030EE9202